jgi:hypothetical protein
MNYYILTYQVLIDGKIQDAKERIAVVSNTEDYRPNQAEDRIVEEFKRKNPASKVTAILQGKPEVMSKENYQAIRSKILEIKSPD